MGPPPLALGLMLNQELYWRLSVQAMMRQDSIVSQQPVGQVPVKGGQVVKQQVLMVIHELFLEGAIEPFGVGVHFRGTGIRPPMGDAPFVEAVLEVPEELRAVVGEEEPGWGGEQGTQRVESVSRVTAGGGGGGQGEGEATVGINEGEQVAAEARVEADHGITREDLQRPMAAALRGPSFAGPACGFGATPRIQADGSVPHLVGGAGDQAADGGDTGQGEPLLRTPRPHQDLQLGLAEVGVAGAQAPDLLAQGRGPRGLPTTVRGAGVSSQGLRIASGLGEGPLPAIERPSAHAKGLTGGCEAMAGEEVQNLES
ncbi:MAG: hypothetical protein OXF47_03880, partial [Nitrospira sp.]|nr:hypothetical protein [Nitrospira sp.]